MTTAPGPRPPGGGFRPWPAGLLAALVLVAGVERLVARQDVRLTTVATSAWAQSRAQVPRAARCRVVCLGDSLVKDGVVPTVLERRHGLTAWNLAVPGGVAPVHYVLLRRLLRAGARPSAVVVDGELLHEDPFAKARVWPEVADLGDLAGLAGAGRDPEFLARMALARALNSYRARAEVRLEVLAALAGETRHEPLLLGPAWRNWNANHGAYVLPDRDCPPDEGPRTFGLDRTDALYARWDCHPVNDRYARQLLDLAEAHGVAVFWLLTPLHPALQALRDRSGRDRAYDAYLHGLLGRYPGLTVVDGRHSGYPGPALADVLHLSRTGAVFYSDSLGALLRDRLDPNPGVGRRAPRPRWVELPRYSRAEAAALAAGSGVEDLAGSRESFTRIAAGAQQAGGTALR